MANVTRLTQLQDRLAARGSRLQINQIVEQNPVPEFDRIGLELQAHRERKGQKLEMAGRVLRIKPAHIRAIEESRFEDLPGKTYAIGFVRSYAEYLGLKPAECIRRFKNEYNEATNAGDEGGAGKGKKPKLAFPEARERVRLPHGSMIILTGIMGLSVWGGWYLTTSAEGQFTDAETVALPPADIPTPEDAEAMLRAAVTQLPQDVAEDEPVTPAEGATEMASAEGQGTDPEGDAATSQAEQMVAALTGDGPQVPPANEVTEASLDVNDIADLDPAVTQSRRDSQVFGMQNQQARVVLRARGNTWVRVEGADGAVLFEETLQRGDSYLVPNSAGVILATRNAGALELMLDGQSLGPAGSVGQPMLDISLEASSLSQAGGGSR